MSWLLLVVLLFGADLCSFLKDGCLVFCKESFGYESFDYEIKEVVGIVCGFGDSFEGFLDFFEFFGMIGWLVLL